MRKLIVTTGMVVLLALFSLNAAVDAVVSTGSEGSEASASAGQEVSPFGLSMHIGTVVRIDPDTGDKKTWSQVRLLPEVRLGKPLGLELALGLDVSIEWDESNKLNDEDWDEPSDAIDKLLYVRWGNKKRRDPFYITLGGLKSVVVGHGLIMDGFSNMTFFPDVKMVGISTGFNSKYGGIEMMVDDVDRTGVVGGRFYIKPLHGRVAVIGDRLAFGGSYVADQRSGYYNSDGSQEVVMVYGADEEFRIIDTSVLSVIQFIDYARIDKFGYGIAAGVFGRAVILDYKVEARMFEPDFMPNYFNNFYMVERTAKRYSLDVLDPDGDKLKGIFGSARASLFGYVDLTFSYEDYERPAGSTMPPNNRFHGELVVSPKLFEAIPKMPKLEIHGTFDKVHINGFSDFFELNDVDSLVKGELLYHMNKNLTIAYVYEKRFEEENGVVTPLESTTVQTRISF